MEEQVKDITLDEVDELSEEDIPSIIYWLIESYGCLEALDSGMMDKGKQKQVEKWKDKIWNTLDYYIKILPSG